MSDLSSSTPSSLTPQSTGTQDSSSPGAAKRSRPQAAFYPNVNATNKPQKPFSRSAAKRESVMALGSIEHLQHYFTKTGIAAKKDPTTQRKGLVPALGGIHVHMRNNSSLSSLPEFELPPSPALPAQTRPAFPPYVKTYEIDPENLRPGAIQDLSNVELVWKLRTAEPAQDPGLLGVDNYGAMSGKFDVLHVLKATTHAIRSVRNYLLSLPDDTADMQRPSYRPMSMTTKDTPRRRVSQPNDPSNPLTLIRRSALEVLTVLRALEESSRIPLSDDAYDAQSDRASNPGHSRGPSPSGLYDDIDQISDLDADTSFAFSVVQVHGRRDSVLVWEEEEDEFKQPSDDERETRERWDERLVLGSGWLYKQDIKLENLEKEKEVVGRYLDAVDSVLFGGRMGGLRGWEREREKLERKDRLDRASRAKGRRISTPVQDPGDSGLSAAPIAGARRQVRRVVSTSILDTMQNLSVVEEPEEMDAEDDEEDAVSVDDDELPPWAKRSAFAEDPFARTHALLVALLPAYLLPLVGTSPTRDSLLRTLSSGQLLCVAYNVGVRRSKKPWGYISKDAIHDIVALEEAQAASASGDKEKESEFAARNKGWTFRRTDNLRLWAAALRLRYMLPIVTPVLPEPSLRSISGDTAQLPASLPSKTKFPTMEPPIYFDARIVARKEAGWEEMLEHSLQRWVQAVVDERRGDAR